MGNSDRLEQIDRTFLHGPGVWPKGYLNHPGHAAVKRAFVHVLLEIPEGVFSRIERDLSFFFDASRPAVGGCLLVTPTIIIFERSLRIYGEDGLCGLLAHELSHHFLPSTASEDEVDALAISWGLGDQIRAMRRGGG